MREPDIIMDLLDCLREEVVDLPEEVAWKVERRIRFEYAGDRVRIAQQPPDLHNRIARLLHGGVQAEAICRRFGVSQKTVFRVKWRRDE